MKRRPTTIKISASMGKSGKPIEPIEGYVFDVRTKSGRFMLGVDNWGDVYVASTDMRKLVIHPTASNRVILKQER